MRWAVRAAHYKTSTGHCQCINLILLCEQYKNIAIWSGTGHGVAYLIAAAVAEVFSMTATAPCPAFSEAEKALLDAALSLPEATEDFPWGERVLKVRGKIFLFLAQQKGALRLSMKLPFSRDFALDLPEATPTGYGLGKSGWVTFIYPAGNEPDVPRLTHWMKESYRAVAPKKLAARLEVAVNA